MWLGGEVRQSAAGAAELVVERDGGREREEAADDLGAERVEGAGAVAFVGEDVLGRPEDAFDALADRGQMGPASGFVLRRGRMISAPRSVTPAWKARLA